MLIALSNEYPRVTFCCILLHLLAFVNSTRFEQVSIPEKSTYDSLSERAKAGRARLCDEQFLRRLFHCDCFDRAFLGAIATADARLHIDDAPYVINEVKALLFAYIHAQTATGAFLSIDLRSLVAGLSHVSPPEAEVNLKIISTHCLPVKQSSQNNNILSG
jgi:hypothetical protein